MERPSAIGQALDSVEQLYSDGLAEHGQDSKAVGWPDRESQLLRFEKLALVLDGAPADEPVTVNDYGCGYAAMFDWLDERGRPPIAEYRGYDISEPMLDAVRARLDDQRVQLFNAAAVDTPADYTFVSGTFNVRAEASDADWAEHLRDTLRVLAGNSRRGLAFNLLTSYVDWRKDDLFYAEPGEWFDFCKSELSRYVTLVHDYPLFEWTMLVRFAD